MHNKSQGHKTATETLYVTVQNDKTPKMWGKPGIISKVDSPYTTMKTPCYVYKRTVRLVGSSGSLFKLP